jgi:hypothetical protein
MRRGLAGEPIWLAVGIGIWMVRRARNAGPEVIWKGRVQPGQRLTVITTDPAASGRSGEG